jgi:hypothetical protein
VCVSKSVVRKKTMSGHVKLNSGYCGVREKSHHDENS